MTSLEWSRSSIDTWAPSDRPIKCYKNRRMSNLHFKGNCAYGFKWKLIELRRMKHTEWLVDVKRKTRELMLCGFQLQSPRSTSFSFNPFTGMVFQSQESSHLHTVLQFMPRDASKPSERRLRRIDIYGLLRTVEEGTSRNWLRLSVES